jgi:hypothetical protein
MFPLEKTLKIEIDRSQILASITYENVADFDVFVLRDQPSIFIQSEGRDILNIGPSEKRTKYSVVDYIRLAPKSRIEFRYDLTKLYDWETGTHEYEASISGNYRDPNDKREWVSPRIVAKFQLSK